MPTENGATDVNGAASAIADMLRPKTPELERPTGGGESPSQQPEVAASEPEATPETLTSDTESETRRFTAKLGDRDVEFDLITADIDPELVSKGLMMESDYRKKTMELGDSRKALEARQNELDAKFNEAAELIQFEVDNLESEEMLELKSYDPESYWKKVDQVKVKADKLTKWRESKQSELEKQQAESIKAESDKLTNLIPDWLDTGKRESDTVAIQSALKDYGFSDDEITMFNAPYDSRMLALARKAMMFDQIQAQDIESKRVKPDPKTAEPTGGAKPNPGDDAAKRARIKARKTGKVRDAQDVIRAIMNFK